MTTLLRSSTESSLDSAPWYWRIRSSLTLSDFFVSIADVLHFETPDDQERLARWLTPILRTLFFDVEDANQRIEPMLRDLASFQEDQLYTNAWHLRCVRARCDKLLRCPEEMREFVNDVCSRLKRVSPIETI
jgi:hypothetical protein